MRTLVGELVKRKAAVDLARHMRTEIERWSKVSRDAGVRLEQ